MKFKVGDIINTRRGIFTVEVISVDSKKETYRIVSIRSSKRHVTYDVTREYLESEYQFSLKDVLKKL